MRTFLRQMRLLGASLILEYNEFEEYKLVIEAFFVSANYK